jgi:hypothetical protein
VVDPSASLPWEHDDDHRVAAQLARERARRALAARAMVAVLLIPLAAQAAFVWLGAAARWGVIVVALPASVAWILLRGRRR